MDLFPAPPFIPPTLPGLTGVPIKRGLGPYPPPDLITGGFCPIGATIGGYAPNVGIVPLDVERFAPDEERKLCGAANSNLDVLTLCMLGIAGIGAFPEGTPLGLLAFLSMVPLPAEAAGEGETDVGTPGLRAFAVFDIFRPARRGVSEVVGIEVVLLSTGCWKECMGGGVTE